MKEEDVTPGTIYPLFGKLLCYLPECLKKKLCCGTPLGRTVSKIMKFNYRYNDSRRKNKVVVVVMLRSGMVNMINILPVQPHRAASSYSSVLSSQCAVMFKS